MIFELANPAGLWALLSIPALVLIHFFQRRSKTIPVSVLFLIEQTQKESSKGNRLEKFIHSKLFWLQLLVLLVLALLLARPTISQQRPTSRVAIVVDTSASMSVFKNEVKEAIRKAAAMDGAKLELTLLESEISNSRLYRGDSIDEALNALDNWKPSTGVTNPAHSLRVGRSIVGDTGKLVYITDHTVKSLPYNAAATAIGRTVENVGFTGVSFEPQKDQLIWKAVIRNYAKSPVERSWHIETDNKQKSKPVAITIPARGFVSVQGVFPENSERIRLTLNSDIFPADDTLPLIRPKQKRITLTSALASQHSPLLQVFTDSFSHVFDAKDLSSADIIVRTCTNETSFELEKHSVSIVAQNGPKKLLTGSILGVSHELVEGLNWSNLSANETPSIKHTSKDTVLVWQGDRPLIFLRESLTLTNELKLHLVFNFDLQQSNALKLDATAILLYRYFNKIRDLKKSTEYVIAELGQPLDLHNTSPQVTTKVIALDGSTVTTEMKPTSITKAPNAPGYFQILSGTSPVLVGSCYFADTREADFVNATTGELKPASSPQAIQQDTSKDHFTHPLLLLGLAASIFAWMFTSKNNS